MSHELTVTVGIDGKFYNIKTSQGHGKKPLSVKDSVKRAVKGKALGKGFATQEEAVGAAGKRSRSFDKPRPFR